MMEVLIDLGSDAILDGDWLLEVGVRRVRVAVTAESVFVVVVGSSCFDSSLVGRDS